jgi:hypothetical protein
VLEQLAEGAVGHLSTRRCGAGLLGEGEMAQYAAQAFHQPAALLKQVAAPVGASTALGIACASAISATSRATVVRSVAQARKVERKTCVVMFTVTHAPQQHQQRRFREWPAQVAAE